MSKYIKICCQLCQSIFQVCQNVRKKCPKCQMSKPLPPLPPGICFSQSYIKTRLAPKYVLLFGVNFET